MNAMNSIGYGGTEGERETAADADLCGRTDWKPHWSGDSGGGVRWRPFWHTTFTHARHDTRRRVRRNTRLPSVGDYTSSYHSWYNNNNVIIIIIMTKQKLGDRSWSRVHHKGVIRSESDETYNKMYTSGEK